MTDSRAPRELTFTMVSCFDLGGRFTDSAAVIRRLRKTARFKDAQETELKGMRLQASYKYSHEPAVLAAAEDIEITIEGWAKTVHHRTTLDPSGIITFETAMPLAPERLEDCSDLEDAFYASNAIHYVPYLQAAFGKAPDEDAPRGPGINLVAYVEELRTALAYEITPRPGRYPGIDMRVVVSALVDDLDAPSSADHVREFVKARRARAQLSEAPPTPAKLEGQELKVERSEIVARRWGSVLFASCDADAVLILADDSDDSDDSDNLAIAEQCVTMAERFWFLARTWVGVLDQIGTVEIEEDTFNPERFRELERRVIDLSTIEYEIERSMVTVEAAGVMLGDTWNVELVRKALERFDVGVQRRLIDQRVKAVARNHDTVAEVLDRIDQQAGRRQADRLQLLFAGAVAAAITGLIPTTHSEPDVEAETWVLTGIVWVAIAGVIYWLSRRRVPLGPRAGQSRLRRLVGAAPKEPAPPLMPQHRRDPL
jgi:hypothetical protein